MGMKIKSMTLQEAETFLNDGDHPFSEITIRRAVMDGKLRANLHRTTVSYYTVIEDDLLGWASDPDIHKPVHKTE
jgi:hypothetical protein